MFEKSVFLNQVVELIEVKNIDKIGFLNQLIELMKEHQIINLSAEEIKISGNDVFIKGTKVIQLNKNDILINEN